MLGTRGIGPAGYSAARAWGVTTQIPAVGHVATLRAVDPIDGVIQHERKNLARADLNEKEIALLELLRSPRSTSKRAGMCWRVRPAPRCVPVRSAAIGSDVHEAIRTGFVAAQSLIHRSRISGDEPAPAHTPSPAEAVNY